MGKWTFDGKFHEKTMENDGKSWKMMGTPWKIMGKPRDIYGCMGRNMRPGTFKRDIYEMFIEQFWENYGTLVGDV